MQRQMIKKLPLNCPYCDEPALIKLHFNRVVTPFKIYTKRECPMGHTFFSVEHIPDDQEEAEEEAMYMRKEYRRQYTKRSDKWN